MRLGESREALVFRSIETANKTKKCIEGRKSLWHDLADERFFFQIGTCSCGSGDDAARHYFQQHTYQSRRRCLGSRYSFPSVFPKYYRFLFPPHFAGTHVCTCTPSSRRRKPRRHIRSVYFWLYENDERNKYNTEATKTDRFSITFAAA